MGLEVVAAKQTVVFGLFERLDTRPYREMRAAGNDSSLELVVVFWVLVHCMIEREAMLAVGYPWWIEGGF
jgi:hypothetical protein